jgi:hypothetical protein
MMGAVIICETPFNFYETVRSNVPEDSHLSQTVANLQRVTDMEE